jgi:hypothetical protein
LIHDDASVNDSESINKIVSSYYKDLFGSSVHSSINVSNFNMNQLSDTDRTLLTAPFTINEIKKVVFEMKHNSAPCPDGFPVEFFQNFWELIQMDVWNLFKDFYDGNLDIERLNYGMVILLPKVDNAVDIKNFRPICLLNVCYKIITKVLNNRLASCITTVISDSQYGFIKNRYIMDEVVSLNEILHVVKMKNQSGVFLKIDFEKAYDKVNWHFLYVMMEKGFGSTWCDWVMRTVRGGKVAIKSNDMLGPYFTTHKGVRQGDLFSPLLFNLVADGLACMIHKAQDEDLIEGLIPHIIQNGCSCLQYADDTIFLIQDCLEGAQNLKFILCLFESMSGLKINFHKSEIFCFGKAKEIDYLYADIFTCPIGCLPMKYLGVPIDNKKINKSLWVPMIEKLEKACWVAG